MSAPICPYCGARSKKVKGADIYRRRNAAYSDKTFHLCAPCDAYVGTHSGTDTPLGRLANAPLRKARNAAHAVFDLKWRTGGMKRKDAYKWLAEQLGLTRDECHIGLFDFDMCNRVIWACGGAT